MGKPESFLGKGVALPLRFACGDLVTVSDEEAIRQSIYVILMTRQGERVMRPDFGSRIWDYVFELPSETNRSLMCREIEQAVARWEHRVDQVQAQVEDAGIQTGEIVIQVSYIVRSTNRPDNMVFPFYLEEGRW